MKNHKKSPKMMRTKIFCSLVIAVLISACSVEKFIPEDEYLYEGADVTVTSDTVVEHKPELETELETVLRRWLLHDVDTDGEGNDDE